MKNKNWIFVVLTMWSFSSCNWTKDKTKETIHKAGEIVGKTGSEFGDGIYRGVKKSFENEVLVSESLKKKGIEIGEVLINSTDSTSDNVLTVYTIFNETFEQDVTWKIFNEQGKEYGRVSSKLSGKKGTARHIDFVFDKRVNIGVRGKISVD